MEGLPTMRSRFIQAQPLDGCLREVLLIIQYSRIERCSSSNDRIGVSPGVVV
jgi:hypothetical protein